MFVSNILLNTAGSTNPVTYNEKGKACLSSVLNSNSNFRPCGSKCHTIMEHLHVDIRAYELGHIVLIEAIMAVIRTF